MVGLPNYCNTRSMFLPFTHKYHIICINILNPLQAFINRSSLPEIWAHETMPTMVDSTTKVLQLAFSRAMRQFGTGIQNVAPKAFRNAGIGPFLRFMGDEATVLILPTHLMKGDTQDVVMAGRLILHFCPHFHL